MELRLEPGNEGIVDDPTLIALELTSSDPGSGDDQVVDKDVTWEGFAEDAVVRVRIQGEASAEIDIRDVS